MAYAVQFRRGTTAEHALFTGAAGEITVNTTTNQLVVHDGVTTGGHVIGSGGGATAESVINTIVSSNLDMGSNKILYSNVYATENDLPAASTYHGMFAHVHGTGKAYYAHAGAWVELANSADVGSGASSSVVSLRQGGTLTTITGTERWYAPGDITITKIAARLGTVANGNTDTSINKNGVAVKTMTIPTGLYEIIDTNNLFTMVTSDYLTIDVTSVAASPGADLNIQIVYTYN
jgi:hypothetical protein